MLKKELLELCLLQLLSQGDRYGYEVLTPLRAAFPELEGLIPVALLPLGYPAEGAHPSRLHTDRQPIGNMVRYL